VSENVNDILLLMIDCWKSRCLCAIELINRLLYDIIKIRRENEGKEKN